MLDIAVVHPAYWRHGHGARMVEWGMELARRDGVKVGVLSVPTGEKLYLRLGFKKLDEVVVHDDTEDTIEPKELRAGVMEYTPRGVHEKT
jgi:GNAT superfamily N-acetyltransferase